jgi:hypothetical protein
LDFFRRHRVAWISVLLAAALFFAIYWIARSTGPAAFQYEIR